MEISIEGTHPGTGLVRAWTFRVMLFVCGIACSLGPIAELHDRYELANGVPATIRKAGPFVAAPATWSDSQQALFDVKIFPVNDEAFITQLYLHRELVERLMQGEVSEIVFVKERPRRHLLKGEPLPSVEWGWAVAGCVFLTVFGLSMKLR